MKHYKGAYLFNRTSAFPSLCMLGVALYFSAQLCPFFLFSCPGKQHTHVAVHQHVSHFYSVCDGLRRYSLVAYLTHLSFMASVLCGFISFLAGVEQAVQHEVFDTLILCLHCHYVLVARLGV